MTFSLGVCSQLPYGTQNNVMERLLSSTLTPLLQSLYRTPVMKILLCLSGFEMEWIENNHPEINILINSLVHRGQIDFLATSYNGLCLQLLPPSERASEVEKSSSYIRRRYSKRPSGFWAFQQIWSASFLSTMSLCSLDFAVISTMSNPYKAKGLRCPFMMNEQGKAKLIIPTNDDISRIILEAYEAEAPTSQVLRQISKLRIEKDCLVDLAMINADQLFYEECSGYSIIKAIIDHYAGRNLSMQLISAESIQHENVLDNGYLGSGIYGFDFRTSFNSPNELLLNNSFYAQYFQLLGKYRAIIKASNIDKPAKKEASNIMLRSLAGYPYIFGSDPRHFRNVIEKGIFELHKLLDSKEIQFPKQIDIDDDSFDELIVTGESFCAIIDSKGGAISSIFTNLNLPSLRLDSKHHLLGDRMEIGGKLISFEKRRFAISFDDKKCSSITAEISDVGGLSLKKSYVFGASDVVFSFCISSRSKEPVSLRYTVLLPISSKLVSKGGRTNCAEFTSFFEDADSSFNFKCESSDQAFTISEMVEGEKNPVYNGYKLQWDFKAGANASIEQTLRFSLK